MKRIGCVRVSTSAQHTDRQVADLWGAGVRRDDLYTDRGVSGAREPARIRPALAALEEGDTLVVTTFWIGWDGPRPTCFPWQRSCGGGAST